MAAHSYATTTTTVCYHRAINYRLFPSDVVLSSRGSIRLNYRDTLTAGPFLFAVRRIPDTTIGVNQ